jgi:hypothetical protein
MNKKQFSLAVLSIALVALVIAFTFSFSTTNNPAPQKWEYLVVSPGKVYWCGGDSVFSNACPPGTAKADVSEATGFKSGEAVELEQLLDKVGQQGWELVDIVGQIGGDQEFVFKRPIT